MKPEINILENKFLFDNLSEAVVLVNKEYQIIYNNPSFLNYFDINSKYDISFFNDNILELCKIDQKGECKINFDNRFFSVKYVVENDNILLIISTLNNISYSGINIEEVIKTIIDNTFNSVIIIDNDIKKGPLIVYVNEIFTKNMGYLPNEVIGKSPMILYGENKTTDELIKIQDYMKGKYNKYIGTITNYHKDGNPVINEVSIQPIFNKAGEITHHISIQNDITINTIEQQKLKELKNNLEKSNSNLQRFAYTASHDLQEPVRIISNYIELFDLKYNDMLDESGKRYIKYIMNASARMRNLINDLLEFSRVNSRQLQKEETNLNGILNEVLETFKYQIRDTKIKIIKSNLPTVNADNSLMFQLFLNLISNAIKFKNSKKPFIKIYSENNTNYYKIVIEDNGIGIEEKNKEIIFELFKRLHQRSEFEGTGIGLSICKSIVEAHNGSIWFESEVGKGSKFIFTIPKIID